jgi:hypothetical protein
MNKGRINTIAIQLAPIVILATFLFQEYNQHSMRVWILTDVLIVSYGIGAFTEGIFTTRIESINRRAMEIGWRPLLGKSWLFMGLSIGALISGFLSQVYSEIATLPQFETLEYLAEYTAIALAILVLVFLTRYVPRRQRKRGQGDFFIDG